MSDRLDLLSTCRQAYKETTSFMDRYRRVNVVRPRSVFRLKDGFYTTPGTFHYPHIVRRIIRYCISPEQSMISLHHDLNTSMRCVTLLNVTGVCRQFRTLTWGLLETYEISATLTINEHSSFEDFGRIRYWLQNRGNMSDETDHWLRSQFSGKTRPRVTYFNLVYDTKSAIDMSQVRLQADKLLFATAHYSITGCEQIYISQTQQKYIRHQQSIENIRYSILVFAYDLMVTHHRHCHARYPTIWMDGNFHIIQADFIFPDGTTESVTNERVEWWKVMERWRYAQNWNLRLDEIEEEAGTKHRIEVYSPLDVVRWLVGFLEYEPDSEEYV